nr:putative ribonuclease H-like domain-containing protein [Tanacetum cinerariifolium]
MTDYSLWEVIINGDSPKPSVVVEGSTAPIVILTAEQKLARRNELKARDEVKHSSSPRNLTQNIAFVSSSNTYSTTDSVSAATSVSAVCAQLLVSSHPNIDSLSNAVIFSFFASQSTSPQLDNEDLKQIDVDDLEEMDLRWQMAMLTMRARRFLRKTRRNLGDNSVTTMCFDCPKWNAITAIERDILLENVVSQCDGIGSYDWSYQAEEEPANFALMAISSSSSSDNEDNIIMLTNEVAARDHFISIIKQKLKEAKTERDDLKLKFEKFQPSSKNLAELIASQTNNKHGLGYLPLEDVSANLSLTCPSDRVQPSRGYNVVPSPITGNFMPPKPDLVFNTAPLVVESNHSAFNVQVSDSEDESEPNDPKSAPSFVQPSEQVKPSEHSAQPVEAPILDHTPKPTSSKTNGSRKRKNRKTCFVCKGVDHLIKDCTFHVKPKTQPTPRNYVYRGYDKKYASSTKKYLQKHRVPAAVFTKFKPVSVIAARPISAADPKIMAAKPIHAHSLHTKNNSIIRRHQTPRKFLKTSNSSPKVTAAHAKVVSTTKGKKGKWVWRPKHQIPNHDPRNMSYLSDFQKLNGRYVAFGGNPKGDFKLPDESQVLLRVPRENNMYNVNLKDIIPSGDLTCLFAKAIIDESNLWHRRLGHVNFKTINKLVKGNLVRGLPTKVFENQNTCLACRKGKQHTASCKTKPVSAVTQPLFRLHIDLFGPTFVKSLNKKCYCLVITDDYSRFTWVFFLATKDKTSSILKTFITGLENQLSLKVKVIKSDNGTEFKNSDLNQFCELKGIKREFSVPRTPQQNGIAKRKNKTLIEAKTMLADSLLHIPFWAEAVNTACYVQNRVYVTKPQNKTPYELLHGRTPSIGFMKPFRCSVTILNTLDSLGKFEGNVD